MNPANSRGPDVDRHERSIADIARSTSRSVDEVRSAFAREFDRLQSTAKVRTHLETLVASKVRAQLRPRSASHTRSR